MTDLLNAEIHCHNIYSNFRNKSCIMPFDCSVTIEEQLNKVLEKKIDVLFVTNHNTLDGYHQILEYQQNHKKYHDIKIYPGEEITIDNKGHVLAYGINKEVKPGMSLEQTLDEIKRQNGVSCAAHPFAVSNGIREKALLCDLIESFNSNNVDIFSNTIANDFSKKNNMFATAGSDSHIASTIGRCINTVESENNLDSIIQAMRHDKFKIDRADYATKLELFKHAHYILFSSRNLVLSYFSEHHPRIHRVAKLVLNYYITNPDRRLWHALGVFGLYLTKRASKKVNIKGYDAYVFENRTWRTLISMSLIP